VRVFDYFNSHFDGNEIVDVSIIGLGAQFIGVPEILGETLGIVCRKAGMFQDLDVQDADVKQKSDAYFSCIGAGFAADGFLHDDPKAKLNKEPNYVLLDVLVIILGTIVAGALIITSYFPYQDEVEKEAKLKADLATYEQGKVAYDKYMATQSLYNQILVGTNMAKKPNDNLLIFLMELEQKLPDEAFLEEFSSDDEQCMMIMYVENMNVAAKVVNTLRGFDSVMDVYVETYENEELEDGDYFYDKSRAAEDEKNEKEAILDIKQTHTKLVVNCVYKPLVEDVVEDEKK